MLGVKKLLQTDYQREMSFMCEWYALEEERECLPNPQGLDYLHRSMVKEWASKHRFTLSGIRFTENYPQNIIVKPMRTKLSSKVLKSTRRKKTQHILTRMMTDFS